MGRVTRSRGRFATAGLRWAAMRRLFALLGIAVLATSSAACVQITDFNPVGTASTMSAAWTIDGAFPTSESCNALGASVVRVVFLDGLRPVPVGALIAQCAQCAEGSDPTCFSTRPCTIGGEVECVDTRPSPIVAEGTWTVRVEAFDGTNVVSAGPEQTVTAVDMGHIELTPVDFLSGRVSATFTIDGGAPTSASCEATGIASVDLLFESAGGIIAGPAIEPCTIGGVGTRVAPGATYTVRLRALADDGSVIGQTGPESFTIPMSDDRNELHIQLNGMQPVELSTL